MPSNISESSKALPPLEKICTTLLVFPKGEYILFVEFANNLSSQEYETPIEMGEFEDLLIDNTVLSHWIYVYNSDNIIDKSPISPYLPLTYMLGRQVDISVLLPIGFVPFFSDYNPTMALEIAELPLIYMASSNERPNGLLQTLLHATD